MELKNGKMELVEKLKINTYFATLGASNMFQFQGNLPNDRNKILDYIDLILSNYDENTLRTYRTTLPHLYNRVGTE